MLRQVTRTNGSLVHVYPKRRCAKCVVVSDFVVGGLYFVLLESGSWAVGCLENGKFLMFDGSEFVKFGR